MTYSGGNPIRFGAVRVTASPRGLVRYTTARGELSLARGVWPSGYRVSDGGALSCSRCILVPFEYSKRAIRMPMPLGWQLGPVGDGHGMGDDPIPCCDGCRCVVRAQFVRSQIATSADPTIRHVTCFACGSAPRFLTAMTTRHMGSPVIRQTRGRACFRKMLLMASLPNSLSMKSRSTR